MAALEKRRPPRRVFLWCGLLAAASLTACSAPPRQRRPARDPSLTALDRLVTSQPDDAIEVGPCLARARTRGGCPGPAAGRRTLKLRLALDIRYSSHWAGWERRLRRTLECVNTLYSGTALRWELASITPWDPGANRHHLYVLLRELRRAYPADGESLVLGITVWDKRRVFASAGGEIGLSQGGACVVPSWPRVENDCLILAHELGHLVGAKHVPGKEWIMGWAARPFHLPAADPVARVTALYRFHPRNVEAIDLHRAATFTRRGLTLPQGCRLRLKRVDRCWRLR